MALSGGVAPGTTRATSCPRWKRWRCWWPAATSPSAPCTWPLVPTKKWVATRGAAKIAALLKERKVRLDFVIDEGLLITEGIMPGLPSPTALIGVAEKGYLSVVLKMSATPGHSSMPPPKGTSAIAMMSAALKRLDDKQLPGGIRGVAGEMFDTIAPEMSGFSRVALSNLWLFGPVVQKQLEAGASTNAMLRTTTALTMVNAGNKENVLPGRPRPR